jgi:glucuronate isomerase
MTFIHDDFLLETESGRRLFHKYAQDEPILDYHNHLPPQDIAENRQFSNLFELWLEGDHYKWRAMRANGVDESLCTGSADPYDKFLAWAKTVPNTLRNPLYHWTHVELKRFFGIDELLSEKTAPAIWEKASALLATPEYRVHGLLRKFNVAALCTTDDPGVDLPHHRAIKELGISTKVYPAFRPDKSYAVDKPEVFNSWLTGLGALVNKDIAALSDLLEAMDMRHLAFHELGGRISDHGMNCLCANFPSEAQAEAIFNKARSGKAATPEEWEQFVSYMMLFYGRLDAKRGWTKQLHVGALRNTRTRIFNEIGPDTGYDSIGDWAQAEPLQAYLDRLDQENALPKIILYNLNPRDSYVLATMASNFQIQYGAAWWFLDTKEGIEWQLNALSNNGLLSRFVGMLTDSRSFASFPRHEYFRRILCNVIGKEVDKGELPNEDELLAPLVKNICFSNANNYLGLELETAASGF